MHHLPITAFTTTGFYFSSFMFLASAILLLLLYNLKWKSDLISLSLWLFATIISGLATWHLTHGVSGTLLAAGVNLLFVLLLYRLCAIISLFGVFFLASMLLPGLYGLVWLYELANEAASYLSAGWPLFLFFMIALSSFALLVIVNASMLSWYVLVRYSPLYFRFPRIAKGWHQASTSKAVYPFVSIHVPCYNEPPEIVNETLNALASLQYPNFEVIVLDNNTKDSAIWKPVAEHCLKLGKKSGKGVERFRFYHFDSLAGAKAGALNMCLKLTSQQAELVSILDADYVAKSDFLEKLIGFFDDPKIGFVQSCQDYRGWQESSYLPASYYEYQKHFKLELSGQNEWDVNYTIGTMCLIRKAVLVEVGGWAEWCLTEDSEVAVRIHALGYTGQYLHDSFGYGLIPETFEAYKQQRFRWTAGPVQQFQKHWRLYLPWSSQSKLSLIQKIGEIFHSLSIFFSESLSMLINIPILLACLWFQIIEKTIFHVPWPVLLFIPIAFVRNVMCNWLYVRLLGGNLKNYIYSALAARSLFFVRNKAFYMAWTNKNLQWKRTDKFKAMKSIWRAFHASFEEMISLGITAFVLVLLTPFVNFKHPDIIFLIWLGILNQAFSLLCTPFMAILSEKNIKKACVPINEKAN